MHPRRVIACRNGARISVMQPPCMLPILMRHIFGVRRIRATRDVHFADPNLDDVPFTLPELNAALQHCALD